MTTTERRPAAAAELTAELATVPMLAQIPAGRLHRLAQAHPAWRFAAGRVLLHQGAPAERLLVMLDGQASAVVHHSTGDRSRYPLMTAPCVIDKAAVLAAGTYPASWVAGTPGRAVTLSAATFWALLREQPSMREHVLRYLARQVGQGRAAAGRGGRPAITRLASWLLAASGPGGRPAIALPAGQQGLAEELGLSRVTVNRALRQLARAGLVALRPRGVTILDPAGLMRFAGHAAEVKPAGR
jgi:CRP/FNR family transcriptional regulator, cyclic AMP receptor protein